MNFSLWVTGHDATAPHTQVSGCRAHYSWPGTDGSITVSNSMNSLTRSQECLLVLSVKDFGDSQGLAFLLLYGKYKLDNLFFLLLMSFSSFQPNLCPILRKTGLSGSSQ